MTNSWDFQNFKISRSSSTCIIFHKTQFSITLLNIPKWKTPFVSSLARCLIMLVHPKHIPGYCYVAMCSKKWCFKHRVFRCLSYKLNESNLDTNDILFSISVEKFSTFSKAIWNTKGMEIQAILPNWELEGKEL